MLIQRSPFTNPKTALGNPVTFSNRRIATVFSCFRFVKVLSIPILLVETLLLAYPVMSAYAGDVDLEQFTRLISKRDYHSAIELTSRWHADNPIDDEVLTHRAHVWGLMEEYGKALSDINLGLKINPNNYFLVQKKAVMLQETGKTRESIQVCQQLDKSDPNTGKVYPEYVHTEPSFLYCLFSIINGHMNLQEYDKAMEYADLIIARYGDEPSLRSHKIEIYKATGEYQKALEEIDRAIAHLPESRTHAYYLRRAVVYSKMGKRNAAVEDYQTALNKARSGNAGRMTGLIYFERARFYLSLNEHQKALTDLNLAIPFLERSDMPEIYMMRGKLHRHFENTELAKRDFQIVIQMRVEKNELHREAKQYISELYQ